MSSKSKYVTFQGIEEAPKRGYAVITHLLAEHIAYVDAHEPPTTAEDPPKLCDGCAEHYHFTEKYHLTVLDEKTGAPHSNPVPKLLRDADMDELLLELARRYSSSPGEQEARESADRRMGEIMSRLAGATKGTWEAHLDDNEGAIVLCGDEKRSIAGFSSRYEADFVAHAPDDIAWLLRFLGLVVVR